MQGVLSGEQQKVLRFEILPPQGQSDPRYAGMSPRGMQRMDLYLAPKLEKITS